LFTDDTGSVTFGNLPDGDYIIEEAFPDSSWIATSATSYGLTFVGGGAQTFTFSNVQVGYGGGLTLGFWSNKNGQKIINADTGNSPTVWQLLGGLNLVNATGANFDPTTSSALATWLLNAKATNMAYMLSAQLCTMELNVRETFVSGTSFVYAPNTGLGFMGFTTVNDLMNAANTGLGMVGHKVTTASGPIRTLQEAYKTALDQANNNNSFVQAPPAANTCLPPY